MNIQYSVRTYHSLFSFPYVLRACDQVERGAKQ